MADDEDNIVRLDQARAKRKSQLDELDEATVNNMVAASQAALGALAVRFNAVYAVVNESGKAWVFRWRRDPALQREVLERIKRPDFMDMYANETLTIVPKKSKPVEVTKSVAQWWWTHPLRRQYLGGVTFDPIGQVPTGYWNLWRGFGVQPASGNWNLMREHIESVLCNGVSAHADYVLDWMAAAVQRCNEQGHVALVFRGKEGCGKGILGRWFAKLFGQHGMQIASPIQLTGRFNEHLRDLIALFADEAFFAGDKEHEGVLKALITEPTLAVEPKGLAIVLVPNLLHLMMASNSEWVIPASGDARRYAMFDVPDARIGQFAYFKAIDDQMRNGGLAAMLDDLLARDISNFEVRRVPQTEALATQKLLSLDTLDRWWLAVLERECVWRSRHGVSDFSEWTETVSTQLLYASYKQWCSENSVGRLETDVALGTRMKEIYGKGTRPRQFHITGELPTWPPNKRESDLVLKKFHVPAYKIGKIKHARELFSKVRKVTGDWAFPRRQTRQ
jgi:hypothetical protein